MTHFFNRPLSLILGAVAATSLGGCYYGDVNGIGYASSGVCGDRYYDDDPYAYDDGYGYDCYDRSDYGSGFIQIGFGGGWYDDYYYPGHGLWMFDRYSNRYPLRDQYLNYWGGRRAYWRSHRGRSNDQWNNRGRYKNQREGYGGRQEWRDRNRDDDRPRGVRPGRGSTVEGRDTPSSLPGGLRNRWSDRDPDAVRPPRRGDGSNNGRPARTRPESSTITRDRPAMIRPPRAQPARNPDQFRPTAGTSRPASPPRVAPTPRAPVAATPRPAPVARPAPPPRTAPTMRNSGRDVRNTNVREE